MQKAENTLSMPELSFAEYRILLPSVFGMAMAAATVNLAIRQAHGTTGISTYGGWSMVAACIVLAALFLSTLVVKRFSKRAISLGVFASIHLAGLSALALALIDVLPALSYPSVTLLLQAGVTIGATLIEFYWMRKLRGTSAQAVVVVVFCALAISEFATFALSFFSELIWHISCVVLMFMQFLTVRASRSLGVPSDSFPAVSESYFGTDENRFSNRSFLMVAALGVWFVSVPIGMGRGFSTGNAIHMSPVPRFMVLLFVCVVSIMWVRFALASRMRALTTSIWVAIELLMGLGAIFFAVWPVTIGIGAAFVMAANLVLQAFVWYMTIAFISFGWRDPYYYASAAWIAMNVLIVAGMHLDQLITQVMPSNAPVIISIMSFFVLVSAQVVFTQLLASPSEQQAARLAAEQAAELAKAQAVEVPAAPESAAQRPHVAEEDVHRTPLMAAFALSPQSEVTMPSKTPDVHIAQSVILMGQQYGLTGREVEVLTLYALGHTQARVSEELQLSVNTVHTHIKRIYEKTDLHSRQEILDYIAEYGQ